MNERIKELAAQAGLEYGCYDRYGLFDEVKFAELIVKECADIAADRDALDIYEKIREHFGVEG